MWSEVTLLISDHILYHCFRVKSFESLENMEEKKVVIKLLECSAEVTRNLSPWCKALPLVDVSLLLDTIYVSPFISCILFNIFY